jgi:hypothetical protein
VIARKRKKKKLFKGGRKGVRLGGKGGDDDLTQDRGSVRNTKKNRISTVNLQPPTMNH